MHCVRTLMQDLSQHATNHSSQAAVVFAPESGADRSITYGELVRSARSAGHRLSQQCSPGARVLLLHPTGIEFVQSLLACMYAGVVPVPVPLPGGYPHQRERLAGIVADAGATLALTDAAHEDEIRDWVTGAESAPVRALRVVLIEPLTAAGGPAAPAPGTAATRTGLDDLAFLQYTSGSTGDPKGVMVTHANVAHHTRSFAQSLDLGPGSVFCSWLPSYHDFGLIGMLLVPLGVGATTYLMTSTHFLKRPAAWLHLIDRSGATVIGAPNFGYEHCLRQARDRQLEGLDLSRVRTALNGAEPIDPNALDGFTRRFSAYGFGATCHAPAYGLAEATLTVSYPVADSGHTTVTVRSSALGEGRFEITQGPPDADDTTRLVGCGTPREGEVILVDRTGAPLADGRVGEIWVRGPVVAAGYWGRQDATRETFGAIAADGSGPWLRTGDLGALHEASLVVTGRLKELLIIHGRNVFPYDLERLLQSVHPGAEGRPGAVFTPTERPGTVVAVQEFRAALRPTDPVTQAEALTELDTVVHEMAARLAEASGAQVTDVVLVRPGRVQRTTSGKIQRGRTREALESGALEPLHSLQVARRSPDPRHDHAGVTA